MAMIDPAQAMGDIVRLARTSPAHLAGFGETAAPAAAGTDGIEGKFGRLLAGALDGVNGSQLKAMDLSQRMITDPSSVNVEDVTIALADANLALSMTKSIVDRALAAYREIINIR
jgi:flagellar hook-basal body complex protein FliE